MDYILTTRIISGLPDNYVDYNKVEEYAKAMKANDIDTRHNGFPPIKGWFDVITKEDVGTEFLRHFNLDTTEHITKKLIGQQIFRVTDGHHRVLAATLAGIYSLECELDKSGFVYTGS